MAGMMNDLGDDEKVEVVVEEIEVTDSEEEEEEVEEEEVKRMIFLLNFIRSVDCSNFKIFKK